LSDAGRQPAGEKLAALLQKRDPQRDQPVGMSDALASKAAAEQPLIRGHGLAHGQRKFRELDEAFPGESAVVTQVLRQVCEHEEEARDRQLSAAERLAYHQTWSSPLRAGLKAGLEPQSSARMVEPHSSLGQAITYLLKPWESLTRFLTVPGAPLDNNVAERALKLCIRPRKNSLCYATEQSAYMASLLTSVIATCVQVGVTALEYLVALQEHRQAVFAHPGAWLPWTYPTAVVLP
jgi:transposase